MDQGTSNIVSKSVDKLFGLGIAFGTLFAGRLVLDIIKTLKESKPEPASPKRHTSKTPKHLESSPEHETKNSPSWNVKFDVATENNKKPDHLVLESHNIRENQDDGLHIPKLNEKSTSGNKSKILRKSSIIENQSGEDTTIIKICFTGGPCAGKTTAISTVANMLRDKGYDAMCVPEAATLIFSSGGILDMQNYSVYQGLQF